MYLPLYHSKKLYIILSSSKGGSLDHLIMIMRIMIPFLEIQALCCTNVSTYRSRSHSSQLLLPFFSLCIILDPRSPLTVSFFCIFKSIRPTLSLKTGRHGYRPMTTEEIANAICVHTHGRIHAELISAQKHSLLCSFNYHGPLAPLQIQVKCMIILRKSFFGNKMQDI